MEPLMSANSAVTVLRSPSGIAALTSGPAAVIAEDAPRGFADGALVADAPRLPSSNGMPQAPQNLDPGALSNPHRAHRALKDAPQWLQNLKPSGLSAPQSVQCMS